MKNFYPITSHVKLLIATIVTASNWFPCLLFHMGATKKQTFVVQLRNDLKVMIRKKSGDMMAVLEDFYDKQYPLESNNFGTTSNSVIIDIGAHIGTFILALKNVYPDARILAYEPDSSSFSLCRRNIRMNKLKAIKVEKLALWKEEKIMSLHTSGNDYLGSSIVTTKGDSEKRVRCTTLLKIFQENSIKSCDLLKIDIEGAEYEVLFSAPESVFKKTKTIYVEYHTSETDPKNNSGKRLKAFLKTKGYKVTKHRVSPILFASK